jgi:FlaA1/EpsC-like NDP-sugar epimerase
MQAAVIGKGGEVFVLDMGEPVKIRYMAEQMIRLAGREPGRDIEIRYIGLRPGEKRFEELFYEAEDLIETSHPKIHTARRPADPASDVRQVLDELRTALQRCDQAALAEGLRRLVPQWQCGANGEEAVSVEEPNEPIPQD